MINVDSALRIILKNIEPTGTEKVKVTQAVHRVLAEDIVAPEPFPSFPCSAVDGFAVRFADLQRMAKHEVWTIAGVSGPGNPFEGEVQKGTVVQVMMGGMIPGGLDTVVPLEHTALQGDEQVKFHASVERGANIKKTGEEIRNGERILREGSVLTPPAIGMLATFGFTKARVHEIPTVNIMATGDELVAFDEMIQEGQVRNSSSPALGGYVAADGAVPGFVGIAPDRKKKIRRKIAEGLDCNLLIITGGSSVGKFDYVKKTLEDIDAEILFSTVNMKPGKPVLFGRVGAVPVFGLPGKPISTLITYLLFVRPAIHALAGRSHVPPFRFRARLDHELPNPDGRRHYVPAIAEPGDGGLHVRSFESERPYAMMSLLNANCLIVLPEDVKQHKKHSEVSVELL